MELDEKNLLQVKNFLDPLAAKFESSHYIDLDPIAVPHAFETKGDIEVIGLFAALLAWGQRPTILSKLAELSDRMGNRPYQFVQAFDPERDGDSLRGFKHRTFNDGDAIALISNLSSALRIFGSLEAVFAVEPTDDHVGSGIERFAERILDARSETPARLRKHVARPSTGSACKRLCMYIRWMVRPGPFDFGLWTSVRPSQLVAPLDVHSGRQARLLGLLDRRSNDWKAALELTTSCRKLDPADPIRYDLALFGIGANKVSVPEHLRREQ